MRWLVWLNETYPDLHAEVCRRRFDEAFLCSSLEELEAELEALRKKSKVERMKDIWPGRESVQKSGLSMLPTAVGAVGAVRGWGTSTLAPVLSVAIFSAPSGGRARTFAWTFTVVMCFTQLHAFAGALYDGYHFRSLARDMLGTGSNTGVYNAVCAYLASAAKVTTLVSAIECMATGPHASTATDLAPLPLNNNVQQGLSVVQVVQMYSAQLVWSPALSLLPMPTRTSNSTSPKRARHPDSL
mmetsp:Transcript_75547/g.125974  ORF Transcript_75547/g.125974 Transcript_75547/m.125974 type:complete len:242 (-) Transcript_75547:190-915(-)